MKFSISIVLLLLYSLIFLAIPVRHLVSHSDLEQPALKISLDVLCTMVGLFGLFTCSALIALHRKLAALEKSVVAKNQQS